MNYIRSRNDARALLFFLSLVAPAAFADPSAGRAIAFADAPRKIRFEVDRRPEDGGSWIHMRGECESVFRCPVDEIIETLWDFEEMPSVFGRIEAVRVRSRSATVVVTEQRTAIRTLGLDYVSNLVFENEMARIGPKTAIVSFRTIGVDRTTKSASGSWYLEEADGPAGAATLVRYSLESVVADDFPAQELVMKRFGENDVKKVVRELAAAVERGREGG